MWTCGMSLTGYRLVRGRGYCWITEMKRTPLEDILAEIDRALDQGFYYLAVATVLTLPDLCVSLASEDGRSNGKGYVKWCNDNLGNEFAWVTGDDLWSFRCGVSHNGRFGDLKHNVGRVIFSLPFRGNTFTNCQMNDAYVYSVEDFCRNFMSAVRSWYAAHESDATLRKNLDRMVQYRPDGLAPYISGMPLLA